MSFRLLGCALFVIILAAFKFPTTVPSQQPPENTSGRIRWEYKVAHADYHRCAAENDLAASLNILGQDGWELVGFQQVPTPFPTEAGGELLVKPAATGSGAAVQPYTADSFQGTISMKMAQVPPGGCEFILKREWHPPARQ